RVACGEFLSEPDAPEESALLAADRNDGRAETRDQFLPLPAHPVGHEDRDRMPQRTSDRGKRDPGIAARRLDDRVAGREAAVTVGPLDNVERHPVLDAPGQIHLLGFRVDRSDLAATLVIDTEEWRVPDEPVKSMSLSLE